MISVEKIFVFIVYFAIVLNRSIAIIAPENWQNKNYDNIAPSVLFKDPFLKIRILQNLRHENYLKWTLHRPTPDEKQNHLIFLLHRPASRPHGVCPLLLFSKHSKKVRLPVDIDHFIRCLAHCRAPCRTKSGEKTPTHPSRTLVCVGWRMM